MDTTSVLFPGCSEKHLFRDVVTLYLGQWEGEKMLPAPVHCLFSFSASLPSLLGTASRGQDADVATACLLFSQYCPGTEGCPSSWGWAVCCRGLLVTCAAKAAQIRPGLMAWLRVPASASRGTGGTFWPSSLGNLTQQCVQLSQRGGYKKGRGVRDGTGDTMEGNRPREPLGVNSIQSLQQAIIEFHTRYYTNLTSLSVWGRGRFPEFFCTLCDLSKSWP